MADRTTKVTLTAQVQGYIAGMKEAAQATRETGSEAEKLAQKTQAFELMGRAAMVAGGTVMAGLTIAAKAAMDWDSAWAGVTKTVDGSPEQLAAVEEGLRGLTGVLPASHTEIAAVAEAAGQLGIQTPNVVEFTRTMIDMGETTNLSSEEAATSLARFMTVMGTSQDDVSRLGSALVDLGNNYATTEAEIMAMAMRLSGAGAQIGMSEGQVLGLSTALSSVGIEAEAGGSAMSKVMIDIASSVEKGGERVEQFAQVAGLSADDFSQKWRTAPGEALAAFVKGLANAEAQGKSTFGILEELGITEVRMRDALLRSASAADQFTEAMETGNEAFGENSALAEEAAKRYETTEAKLSIMANRVKEAFIGLGENLLPVVDFGAESIGHLADAFAGLPGPMESVVVWGGAILGTGLLGAGVWMTAVPHIAKYRAAMEDLNLAGGKLDKTLGIVGKVAGLAAVTGVLVAVTREAELEVTGLTNALERNAEATEVVQQAADAVGNQGMRKMVNENHRLKVSADEVSEALEHMQKNWFERSFLSGSGSDLGHLKDTRDVLKAVADEIAVLAETDVSGAQQGLSDLADEYSWSREEMWQFIKNSPDLKSALEDQAAGFGLSTEKADLLKIAFGEVGGAAKDSADGTEASAEALSQLEENAAQTQEAISALADEIAGFGSTTFDMRDANRQLEESYQALSDALEENGNNFDISTEGGRQNEAALDGVARAANDAAAKVLEETGSQEQMNAKLEEGRQRLIDIVEPYFGSRDAAAAYVDQLNLISPQKVTEIVAHTQQAVYDLDTYIGRLNSIPSVVSTEVRQFQALIYKDPASLYENANGGMYAYANGGISTGIYAGGPPIHKFAEPETGWEAYISGKPSERDRNRQIWVESGERLGIMQEIRAALAAGGARESVNLTQQIYAQPGMSATEVGNIAAAKVGRKVRGLL